MWNDLNMHDRHKLIRLAVTNGVYDLDTIHSLYDDVQNTYDKGGPIGRKLIRDINERSDADFVKRLQDRNREYIVNPDNTISTHKLSWATDDQGNAVVYPEVQNTPAGLMDYSYDRNRAFEEALRNRDTLMMSPSQAEWFTTHYKKYYPSFRYDKGGNMKIAPYRDNSSYADRKLYRNVKRDFRKDPEVEYKDYEDYGVRVYNPSLSSDAPNRKERQEAMLNRIRQDFPEIQKNDVKKTTFKSNTLGWHNNNTGYMGTEDKRTLFGLQQEYDFVNNIVPYGKLGMDTPENIRRKEELERKNRNTTFDYTNNFAIGGNLPTEPNRTLPFVDRTIEMLRMKALEKALMEQSQNIPNVMPVNDAIAYNYAKPYVTPQPEVVNLADVLNTPIVHPMSRKPGISLNTNGYEQGGNPDKALKKSQEIVQFMKDYYNSPAFFDRVARENANLNRHNRIGPEGYEKGYSEGHYNINPNSIPPKEYKYSLNENMLSDYSYYDPYKKSATVGIKGNPEVNVLAHELTHASPFWNTRFKGKDFNTDDLKYSPYYHNDYRQTGSWKYKLQPKEYSKLNPHDRDLAESYSDLMEVRYWLQKKGYFDNMNPEDVMTKERMYNILEKEGVVFDTDKKGNKIYKGFNGKEEIPFDVRRFLFNHKPDQIIDAINDVAYNNKEMNYAKCGGKIRH